MELEGTLVVERRPMRRWVPIVAVTVPVIVFVIGAAWFIRAFVAPPMVAIPGPMVLASATVRPAEPPVDRPQPEPQQPAAVAEPAAPPPPQPAAEMPVSALPMFASLAAAPPSLATTGKGTTAFADPVADHPADVGAEPAATDGSAAQSAISEASEAIASPVPLPRSKPPASVAFAAARVPLPRSRPTELNPEPEAAPVDRHAVE